MAIGAWQDADGKEKMKVFLFLAMSFSEISFTFWKIYDKVETEWMEYSIKACIKKGWDFDEMEKISQHNASGGNAALRRMCAVCVRLERLRYGVWYGMERTEQNCCNR